MRRVEYRGDAMFQGTAMNDDLVRTDIFLVDKRDELSSVVGFLRGDTTDVPIVVDGDTPYGILNERGMMRSRLHPTAHVGNFVVGTRFLPRHGTLDEAVDICLTSGLSIVPVEDGGEVAGYVRAEDLAREVARGRDGDVVARQLMEEVEPLAEATGMEKAVHELGEGKAPVLPVVDDTGHVSGVLRRRDAIRLLVTEDAARRTGADTGMGKGKGRVEHRAELPVRGFLDPHHATLPPDASLADVVDALGSFGDAVVVEGLRPVGIVTPQSVLRVLVPRA